MYVAPDKASPRTQIAAIEKDLTRIREKGGRVGPGIYSHLGYMYYIIQDYPRAEHYLRLELEMYPEAEVFLQRLLQGLEKVAAND